MSGIITWEDFVLFSEQILKTSLLFGDGWSYQGCKDVPGGGYLMTRQSVLSTLPVSNPVLQELEELLEEKLKDEYAGVGLLEADRCTWEYHILFSLSYSVPVLYFNCWRKDGGLIGFEELISMLDKNFEGRLQREKWNILSQQEHPLLRQPFFYLHPCSTVHLLRSIQLKSSNLLVTWLSFVGPMVGLNLHQEYTTLTAT